MKYFIKELFFFGINSSDKSRRENADRLSKSSYEKYHANLSRVLPNVPKRYRAFFENNAQLGDSTVHKITFGSIPESMKCQYKRKNYVEIYVTHAQNGKLYVLKYTNIRKCIFDHPSKETIYFEKGKPLLDDWYTDELCMTKDKWFTHEIIFKSGATLFLEFEKFSYKTKKNN